MRPRASALVLALVTSVVAAQSTPPGNKAAVKPPAKTQSELRMPRGPIKITAERADLEQRESALYRGNVRLVSDEVELYGDRLELKQPVKGEFHALLTGRPARLKHKGAADVTPVAASAEQIEYDTRSAIVQMSGGAQLERGTDTVASETISYNLAARRISATGTGKGQVQITIQPTQNSGQGGGNGSKR
jgi:lipopolysaccharide export system protein LptA